MPEKASNFHPNPGEVCHTSKTHIAHPARRAVRQRWPAVAFESRQCKLRFFGHQRTDFEAPGGRRLCVADEVSVREPVQGPISTEPRPLTLRPFSGMARLHHVRRPRRRLFHAKHFRDWHDEETQQGKVNEVWLLNLLTSVSSSPVNTGAIFQHSVES